MGRCPFHRDGRPSLVVYPENESYFCFGCSAGGDVIDFVARLHGVGFKEAAAMLAGPSEQQLADAMTLAIAEARDPGSGPSPPTEAESRVIDAAASFYHDALWRSQSALAYLAAQGIDRRTARRCRLGFGMSRPRGPSAWRGLSLAAARACGAPHRERDTMLGRIVVPDLRDGSATWLTGRALGEATPRYLNLRLPTPLLGLGRVCGDESCVTEGPFDWLTAVQWGLPAVALLGTHVSRATARDARALQPRVPGAGRRRGRPPRRRGLDVGSRTPGDSRRASARRPRPERPGTLSHRQRAFQRCLELANHRKETQWERSTEQPGGAPPDLGRQATPRDA